MLKTFVYIPDHINEQLIAFAKHKKTSKADIIRTALDLGMKKMKKDMNTNDYAFPKLWEIAKKYRLKGPTDLSTNHDDYLWK